MTGRDPNDESDDVGVQWKPSPLRQLAVGWFAQQWARRLARAYGFPDRAFLDASPGAERVAADREEDE